MYAIAPSILAADFTKLGDEVRTVSEAGAQYIHIDVMDGNFVPSISFGMPVISSIRAVTDKVFDVHLMVTDPERYIKDFASCGADIITVHVEACKHLDRTIALIREAGLKAGVSLNPATSLNTLDYILDQVDMVLVMSVNPGFGGQAYLEYTTKKITELRERINVRGLDVDIEVDGGINKQNVREVLDAGANIIVAGSSIFGSETKKNISEFLEIIREYG